MNKIFCTVILFITLSFCTVLSNAQKDSPFLRRELKIGYETYGYRVFVPKNNNRKKNLSVMLYLHNNGANGTDNEKQIAGFDKIITSHST